MAITTIKSTYALDVATVRALEGLARRWNVSKSEALRRAVRVASGQRTPQRAALAALDQLQKSLRLTPAKARAWARATRQERRAWSTRREPRPGRSTSTRTCCSVAC